MEKIIVSQTSPANTQVMWVDISNGDKQLKCYINGEWATVSASTNNVLDLLSYGISWKPNVADPVVTRVGNMTYHKTLPIQNNMKGCIAQMVNGVEIMYYLDASDWRWREDERNCILESQELTVTGDVYTLTNDIFATYQYEAQWIKINNVACQVISINTSTATATIKPDSAIDAGTYDITFGAVLNGYDGEVMVLVPEFYIRSWDTDTQREVRISPFRIDSSWEYQPSILVAAYHDTVLNTVPTNMGYLGRLSVNSAISVCNTNGYCRGGNNDTKLDAYLTTDKFRTHLGKPRGTLSVSDMRSNAIKAGKQLINYNQYKRILYWLYCIEYANFDCCATFNPALTSEGYHQGGLGDGVTSIDTVDLLWYNSHGALTPNGYTNEFGNGTNTKAMTISMYRRTYTRYAIRWHGIENPFGDLLTTIYNIGVVSTSDKYFVYDINYYGSMRLITVLPRECDYYADYSYNYNHYVKEWNLGDKADIFPRPGEGDATKYKCAYCGITDGGDICGFGGSARNSALGIGTSYHAVSDNTTETSQGARWGYRTVCEIY
jgi:hypothetical protein